MRYLISQFSIPVMIPVMEPAESELIDCCVPYLRDARRERGRGARARVGLSVTTVGSRLGPEPLIRICLKVPILGWLEFSTIL